jgi:hypothetical protein
MKGGPAVQLVLTNSFSKNLSLAQKYFNIRENLAKNEPLSKTLWTSM